MKKELILGLILALTVFAVPAYAMHHEDKAEHIAVMRQAAKELQATNADLAKKLNDYADKKQKYVDEWSGEDKAKYLEQKREDISKIREASTALGPVNNDLGGELGDIADRWEQKLKDKEKHANR